MVGDDEFPRPGALENLGLEDQSPPFDVREFLGLDPWPPRRSLNALQRARLAKGVSQEELAAELAISRQTVSTTENRRHTPSVRLALAFAVALNSTVEELFAEDELR